MLKWILPIFLLFISSQKIIASDSTNFTKSKALKILAACKERYKLDNEGFWATLTSSNLEVLSPIIEMNAGGCNLDFENESDINGFLSELDDVISFQYEKELLEGLNKKALNLAIENEIRYSLSFIKGSHNLEALKNSLREKFKALNINQKKYDALFKQAYLNVKKENLPYFSENDSKVIFRSLAQKINQSCLNMRDEIKSSIGHKPVNTRVRGNQETRQEKYAKKLGPFLSSMKSTINQSRQHFQKQHAFLNSLLYTDQMRDLLPFGSDFINKCLDTRQKTTPIKVDDINISSIKKAKSQVKEIFDEDLNQVSKAIGALKNTDQKDISDTLSDYLKYKPYLYGDYFKEISPPTLTPKYAKYICKQARSIYQDDETWNTLSLAGGVVIGVGAGLFTMGMGTMAALGAGTAAAAVEGGLIYVVEQNTATRILDNAASARISDQITNLSFEQQELIANDRKFIALMAAGSIAAAPLTHFIAAPARSVARSSQASINSRKIIAPQVLKHELSEPENVSKFESVKKIMREFGHLKEGEDLSEKQKMAIVSAHKVGGDKKGYLKICPKKDPDCLPLHEYTTQEIRLKVLLLRGDNKDDELFPKDVREFMIRTGITGKKKKKIRVDSKQRSREASQKAAQNSNHGGRSPRMERLINEALEQVRKLACMAQTQDCLDYIDDVTPGIKRVVERFETEGRNLVSRFVNILKNKRFEDMSKAQLKILSECLGLKPDGKSIKCNKEQLDAVITFMEKPLSPRPHPYFYTRIVQQLEEDHNYTHFTKAMRFFSKQTNEQKNGRLLGAKRSIEVTDDKTVYLNGKEIKPEFAAGKSGYRVNNTGNPEYDLIPLEVAEDFARESKAFDLLKELGHTVHALPEESNRLLPRADKSNLGYIDRRLNDEQVEQSLIRRFQNLRNEAGIATNRSPDLIIELEGTNGVIADIYSPRGQLSTESVSKIRDGILLKTESKRQTNRVIIYVEDHEGYMNEIADKVRKSLGESTPEHLEEASIIYKDKSTNEAKMISVWP